MSKATADRKDDTPVDTPTTAPEHTPDGASNVPVLLAPRTGARRTRVEAGCVVDQTEHLERTLRENVIGQDQAIERLVCASTRLLSGLRDPSRPQLTTLLLGPTGVGKTETAKALASALFGSPHAMTRVDCEEYAHGHEVSKLLGSPPGYVGGDIEPILSQRSIDAAHRAHRQAREAGSTDVTLVDALHGGEEGYYHSVILFDEIEKAHPILWNALLGILEDGRLTLGNNETVDFTHSIIIMTSNVGGRRMGEEMERTTLGFRTSTGEGEDDGAQRDDIGLRASIDLSAVEAAREVFPPEFLNRLDEILVYGPLAEDDMDRILAKFIGDLHRRALEAGTPLVVDVAPDARAHLIDAGIDVRFGARPLRRAVERQLVDPLSRLIATGALGPGDVVEVDVEGDELAFYRVGRARGSRL